MHEMHQTLVYINELLELTILDSFTFSVQFHLHGILKLAS